MIKENVIRILKSVTEESLFKYKAQIRGIFGSVARGDETAESDIDVLVDFTENADLFDFVGAKEIVNKLDGYFPGGTGRNLFGIERVEIAAARDGRRIADRLRTGAGTHVMAVERAEEAFYFLARRVEFAEHLAGE